MRIFLTLLLGAVLFTGARAQSPGGVAPNLTLWLKANDGPEQGPGVPATNGIAITNWVDRSLSGNDYPAVAGPTLQDNTLNFNPSVQILGGGFDAPVGAALTDDWSVFFISKKLASDDDGRLFDGNSGNYLWAHWSTFRNSLALNGLPGDFNGGIATAAGIRALHLHTYIKESVGGSVEARADGTSLTTFGASSTTVGIGIDINEGASAATEASNSQVGEMILYNTPLSASDVIKIESYLGIKYGLTLAHDYVASDATVVWDATANAAYHNNVTGIGLDGASALNQQKSKSLNAGAAVTIDAGGGIVVDKSFLLLGDDLASGISTNVSATYSSRSNRIWKTAVTGTPGAVTVSIDLSLINFPNTGNAADYALLTDANTDFSSGSTAHTGGASLLGSVLTFTGVTLNNNEFFSVAASLVLPGGVAGNIFWVKADAGVTASPDVSNWADQSGLGNDATQAIAGQQPTLVGNAVNFNPAVDFSGATDIMSLTAPPANLNTTVFAVGVPAVNTQWRTMFRGATGDYPLIVFNGGTDLGYFDDDNIGFNPSGFTWLQNEPAVVGLEMRAGDVNFRKNGSQGASITTVDLTGRQLDFLGNTDAGSQQFGRISEAIVFNTPGALTTTQKEKIESYLAVKYGVTLSHNYLASDATVTWNAAANAAYPNNIAGIGRDDDSSLDQSKSKSVNAGGGVTIDAGGTLGTDKNFLLWGDDLGTGTSLNVSSSFTVRSGRVWKTAVTGTPGAVAFSVDLTAINFPNTGNAANYALLTDTNTDFSSGSTTHTAGASLVGSILTFTGVTFNNDEFFTIAASNIVLPGGVAGNVFWVKADAGTTGSPDVSAWADQSGVGNDAVQPTAAQQPTLVTGALNFHPVVDFSGSTDIMSLTAPPANLNSTVFAVGIPSVNSQWRTMFRGSVSDFPLIVFNGGIDLGYFDEDDGGFKSGGVTWLENEPAVIAVEMRPADVNYRKNGSQGASITTINLAGANLNYFGNFELGNQQFGRIAESAIFNTTAPLTATEKQKVESYLAVKYGITINHNYLTSDATVTWDVTANAVYQNNVAGVGRDDNTALDQRKSLSVNTGAALTIDKGGAFGTDMSFLVWGNDLGSGLSTNVSSSYSIRTGRIWKAAVTGTPGPVTFSVDLSLLGFPNTGNASNYALLTDANTDFSTGSTAHTTGAGIVGSILTFTGVNFSDNDFFAIAAYIPFPGGVAGPVFWVKGNAGVTASPDVSIWADQSGSGNNAVQPIAGQQPTLQNSALNFNPIVNFSDAADIMNLTSPPTNLNSTVFAVGVPSVNTQWRTMFRGAGNDFPMLVENGGTALGYFDGDVGFSPSGFTWLENEAAVAGLEMLAGDVNFRKNGTQGASINTINLTGFNLDFLGNWEVGGQQFGKVAEAVIYNSVTPLSTADKQKIESYLAIKYGVSLTHNYVASDATVAWDVAANAAYPNNIAGIGRDDASALDQRKSMSSNPTGAVTMDVGGALATDKNFLLWGDDLGTGTSPNVSGSYALRSNRIWKTAITGTPGAVTINIDLSTISLPNNGIAANYELLTDTDTDFSSGFTAHTGGASLVGSILTFTGVTFNDDEFFTIAAVSLPNPGGVTGSVFWARADLGVIASPDVSQWTDQSGTTNNALQPVAAQRPSPVTNVLNSNPAVNFSGATDIMALTTPPADLNSTIFAVGLPAANTQWRTMFKGNAATDFPIIVENGGTALGYFDEDNVGFKPSGFTWLENEPAVIGLEMLAGDVNFRKNGTQGASITDIDLTGLNIDFFGNYFVGNQQFGRIAEAIIFNDGASLTSTEKQKVESYLAVKYGITLSHDYLASDATMIWNSTTNAAYLHEVAGVGRDDDTALDQRKSTSSNAGAIVTVDKGGVFGTDKSYLIWGDDNAAMDATGVTDVPSGEGVLRRIARAWKLGAIGTVGAVSMQFDLSTVLGSKTAADLRLLVDRNKDGLFADETVAGGGIISGAVDLGGDIFQFPGVTFNDGELVSVGSVSLTTPLPISLLSFNATVTSDGVRIAWSTASEINNDYFTIQKSADGFEFSELTQVRGAGTSTARNNYEYLDKAPYQGFNYYRLTQTDRDGKSTHSPVISVKVEKMMSVYPNPARSQFIVEAEGIESSSLIITNSLGQRVPFSTTESPNKVIVNTADMVRGIYVLMMNHKDRIVVEKIVLE